MISLSIYVGRRRVATVLSPTVPNIGHDIKFENTGFEERVWRCERVVFVVDKMGSAHVLEEVRLYGDWT